MTLAAAERSRLGSDAAFVASYYPQRGTLVRALAATMNVGLWGHGWDRPDAQRELGGAAVVRGGVIGDATAVKIYNAAAIGLNAHHPQNASRRCVNTRTFELLASGTPPLVDRIAGIEELLEPDAKWPATDRSTRRATSPRASCGTPRTAPTSCVEGARAPYTNTPTSRVCGRCARQPSSDRVVT
jgi:hypothetical protein